MRYLFPFDMIRKNSRIAIYGFGKVGKDFSYQVQASKYCILTGIYDNNYETIDRRYQKILPTDELSKTEFDYVVIAIEKKEIAEQVASFLIENGIQKSKIIHEIRKCDSYTDDSYSQFGADCIVNNIFAILGMNHISYLDIGANHPVIFNSTWMFYNNGCHGVAVDANIRFEEDWNQFRPNDVFVFTAIGDTEGTAELFFVDPEYDVLGGLSTIKNDIAGNFQISETVTVPVTTLDKVVNQYCGGIYPEFLSIDIEGMEYEALEHSSLNSIVVAVEIDKTDIIKMNKLMQDKGYFAYCRTIADMIYVKEQYKDILFTKLIV